MFSPQDEVWGVGVLNIFLWNSLVFQLIKLMLQLSIGILISQSKNKQSHSKNLKTAS